MGDFADQGSAAPVDGKADEHFRDRSYDSDDSTPEDIDIDQDQEPEQDNEAQGQASQQQQPPQQQKRKGGRKPIYATSEERKQRNRQAQAAFRERRTEYIKQLESTIKVHEEALQTLNQSHRTAADECLMLRYKNSLLERILLEKGIDVQAELQAKTGSPSLNPIRGPVAATPLTQPIQRYAVNKLSQNRRSLSAIPKPDHIATNHQPHILPQQSPRTQPIASSHLSSPALSATKSPNFLPTAGAISPSFGPVAHAGQQAIRPQPPLRPSYTPNQRPSLVSTGTHGSPSSGAIPTLNGSNASMSGPPSAAGGAGPTQMTNGAAAVAAAGQFYPSPFQTHYDQLDQEYDAQDNFVDEHDHHHTDQAQQNMPSFNQAPHNFGNQMMPPQQPRMQSGPGGPQQMAQQNDGSGGGQAFGNINQMFGLEQDPMLDADPFGLSASMHFPTQFSFNGLNS